MFLYPFARRSSTGVDSPAPMSMIEADKSGAARTMRSIDRIEMRAIPAHRVRRLRPVDGIPVRSCVAIHIVGSTGA